MGQPRPLFRLFSVFSKNIIQFLQINVKKCPSSKQRWDSNQRPFEHELSPITTRPGLPPSHFLFCIVSNQTRWSSNWCWLHCNGTHCNVDGCWTSRSQILVNILVLVVVVIVLTTKDHVKIGRRWSMFSVALRLGENFAKLFLLWGIWGFIVDVFASDTRGPQFESSNRIILYFLAVNCIEKTTKMCKKRPAIVQFLNKHFVSSVTRLVIEYLATYYNVNLPKQHQNLAKY